MTNNAGKVKALFDGIDKRVLLDKDDSDSAYFDALMVKLEYLVKLVTSGIVACIGDEPDRHRYSLEHNLVRAESIGTWVEVLQNALTGPSAQYFLPASRTVVKELTERVGKGDWRYEAFIALRKAGIDIGAESEVGARVALRQFFSLSVQIRNRSRGHGATTTAQKSGACNHLESAVDTVIENLGLFKIEWAYLHRNLSGKYRVSALTGTVENFGDLRTRIPQTPLNDGVYMFLDAHIPVSLVFSDPDLHDILLPNGRYRRGEFEALSYVLNSDRRVDGRRWQAPPGKLPPSETHGTRELENFGNALANVPPRLHDYVPRPELEQNVVRELLQTDRHPVVTLTGPGGIGKTAVAIAALYSISEHPEMPYEVVLWLSARDIDLQESGARPVQPRVVAQDDIARVAAELLGAKAGDEPEFDALRYFEGCLQHGAEGFSTLFVLDNFETVQNPGDVYEWLDTHVRLPNRVLVTTRTRDFRGDFPLEIGGMTDEQAAQLIDRQADRLGVRELVSAPSYRRTLIDESYGHPYVIRIMLGQVARERRTVTPERILADADSILQALFERTYEQMEPSTQRAFLLLASWRVIVPEIAIRAVLLRSRGPKIDVQRAVDELARFSLLERTSAEEQGQDMVSLPLAASVFGRFKLAASSLRPVVEEDRKLLMEFGPGKGRRSDQKVLPRIQRLYEVVASSAQSDASRFDEYRPLLEYMAKSLPEAFVGLSELVWEIGDSDDMRRLAVGYLRAYLETDAPVARRRDVWRRVAERCRAMGDAMGEIHGLCEVALLASAREGDMGNCVNMLNNRLRVMKAEQVDAAWSEEVRSLLHSVCERMQRGLADLTSTDCSRLAWLYMNNGSAERARDIVHVGLKRDPQNGHCQNLQERLAR